MKKLIAILLLIGTSLSGFSQLNQSIRGKVVDADTKNPLIGATVSAFIGTNTFGAISDQNGNFIIKNVPVGRVNVQSQYLGYEPTIVSQVEVKSAKELVLEIEMREKFNSVEGVVIKGKKSKEKPLNEMAAVSARSFTVEETSRYAAAAYDPARMSQNFAGVTIAGDDLSNEIVVRGNAPKGVLWRLEGIEITNPNHFASGGSQGGAISMLSSSTLGNSDFYTGAFPAEYGNALSGVFDLKFRKGNNEKRESAFMFGFLGLEASSEGPFSKDYEGSYLINYRYSTLGILEKMGVSPTGDLLPVYQDLSYNIFLPTKKLGNFSVFGVMGLNEAELKYDYDANDTTELTIDSYENFAEKGFVNNTGIKHIININNKGYLKTIASHSYSNTLAVDNVLEIDSTNRNKTIIFQEDDIKNIESQYRISSMLNYKLNSRNILRIGGIYSHIQYDFKSTFYDYLERSTFEAFKDNNRSAQYQAFGQFKSRLTSDLTLNAGIHYTKLQATQASSLEPRASLSFKSTKKSTITLSAGKHSKAEHLSLYMYSHKLDDGTYTQPNSELELSKAWHYVLAYDYKLNPNLRLKSEVYYQSLFDIPISSMPGSTISSLNTANYWEAIFGS
ncbi:MAG: TonB-dependent receptor, partial [Bacteroidia bacterium]